MAKKPKYIVEYGFPEQRDEFSVAYLKLLQCMPNIKTAVDDVLNAAHTKTRAQQVIWGLARLAFEDEFQTMILLCANGYSFFARQPLRALFEKVVTLLYLKDNPKESKLYQKYRYILQHRQLKRLPHITRSAAVKRQIQRNYKRHKGNYPIKTRWNIKSIPQMAKEVGIPEYFIESAYYSALQEAHPSLIAMLYRFERRADGSLWWKDDLPPVKDSKETLMLAHFFVLKALEAVREYFKIKSVDQILTRCNTDYLEAWNLPSPTSKTS
jgi:hypothetical protein